MDLEEKLFKKGIKTILAIDEVGRGSLAGPFFVGGLLIDKLSLKILKNIELKDSKKLSPLKRLEIYKKIKKAGINYYLKKFTNKEVDKFGINNCFKRAIYELYHFLRPDFLLVDGLDLKLNLKNAKFIIKGDSLIKSISAISIISKVKRDQYMEFLDRFYLPYKFKENKGYGTKEHIKAIKKFGLTKHHRISFCKNIIIKVR